MTAWWVKSNVAQFGGSPASKELGTVEKHSLVAVWQAGEEQDSTV